MKSGMAEEGVSGVFRLAVAPLAAAGAGGQQSLAAADGVVHDIQAVKRYGVGLCVSHVSMARASD